MRIGIDVRLMTSDMTGIGKFLNGILGSLLEIDKFNQYIFYYCDGSVGDKFKNNENIKLRKIKLVFKKRFEHSLTKVLWEQVQFPFVASHDHLDILFSPYFDFPLIYNKKFIVTIHDISILLFPKNHSVRFRIYYYNLLKYIAKKATKIITVSNNSKKDICNYLDVPEEKIEVIYGAVEENCFSKNSDKSNQKILKKYGIKNKFILYSGGMGARKNLKVLVKAFAEIQKNAKEKYDLVLTGEKNIITNQLSNLTKELGIRKNVIFTGYILEKDLSSLYHSAELMVYPSLYEGFGFPLLEAMICGTPIICSNSSSLPEVVGDAALLVDTQDYIQLSNAIIEVLNNETLKIELLRKGIVRVKKFSWKKSAKKLLSVLEEVYFQN